jgi:hypothetical protein
VSEHGTVSRYFNGSCRCDLCRAAATAYGKKRRQLRANAKPPEPPPQTKVRFLYAAAASLELGAIQIQQAGYGWLVPDLMKHVVELRRLAQQISGAKKK